MDLKYIHKQRNYSMVRWITWKLHSNLFYRHARVTLAVTKKLLQCLIKITLIWHLISLFVITISAQVTRDQFVKPLSNYCLIKKNFDGISKRTLYFCTQSYEIKFSSVKNQLLSFSMQSYYQYFIALVSARSVIVSSEGQNLVNFCPILTN